MQFKHSYRTATDGTPLLGKAEAALYLLLLFVFDHIHPRYQDYIDTLGAWQDWQRVISRTAYQNSWRAYYAKPKRDWAKPFRLHMNSAPGRRPNPPLKARERIVLCEAHYLQHSAMGSPPFQVRAERGAAAGCLHPP